MLKGLNILFLSLLIINNIGYSQNFEWVNTMGGTSYDVGTSLTTDYDGYIYTTGFYSDTVDFDPGPGTNIFISYNQSAYIQKLNSDGIPIWTKSINVPSTNGTNCQSNFITTDSLGNVYITGLYQGTVDFDPGIGVYNLTSINNWSDIFILKLDSSGNFIWAKSFGNSFQCNTQSSAIDSNGNIYTTGWFYGTLDFDPGPSVFNLISNGNYDIFVLKLDSSGNFIWAKSTGGWSDDLGLSINVDINNNLYVSGYFKSPTDFDFGSGTLLLTPSTSAGNLFIQKLTSNGDLIWVKQIASSANSIKSKTDNFGNFYFSSVFYGTVDVDPGPGITTLTSNGLADIFIEKLDSSGNFLWAKSFGGPFGDHYESIAINDQGSIYLTGTYKGTVDFDPGIGILSLTSNNSGSATNNFIQKLDTNGNSLWTKDFYAGVSGQAYGLNTDRFDNVYLTSWFEGTVDLNPTNAINICNSNGFRDIFILKLSNDSCSNLTLLYDSVSSVTCMDSGYIAVHAIHGVPPYSYEWNTNPIIYDSVVTIAAQANYNCKVTDNNGCEKTFSGYVNTQYLSSSPQNAYICQGDSILIGNLYYKTSGTYNDTIQTPFICDSLFTINLTVFPSYLPNQYITICQSDSALIYGSYQTSAGTYYDSLQTINGCDSVLSTTLLVNPVYLSNTNDTVCQGDSVLIYGNYENTAGVYYDSLQSILGCDSVLATTLFLNANFNSNQNQEICQGDSALIYGTYQYASGVYYDSLQTINGCDSVLSITLTVNPLPNVTLANFNPDTICSNSNAVALPNGSPSGGVYSGTGVSGGTFDPNIAGVGTHHVIYTYTDTNSCINSDSTFITVEQCVGMDGLEYDFGILIYPNPNTGLFTIEKSSELDKEISISLLDATSRIIIDKVIPKGQQKIEMDITSYSKGVYYLQLTIGKEVFVKQILKN